MKTRMVIITVIFAVVVSVLSLPINSDAFTRKDREQLAGDLTFEYFQNGQVISCTAKDKNATTLEVVQTSDPNITALSLSFSKPSTMRRLKSYGFRKVVVKGIGWANGVSQGVKAERTIPL